MSVGEVGLAPAAHGGFSSNQGNKAHTDADGEPEKGDTSYRILDQIGPACAEQCRRLDVGAGVIAGMIVPKKGVGGVSMNSLCLRAREHMRQSGLVPCHG